MSQKRMALLLTHSPSRQMQHRASSLVVSGWVLESLRLELSEVLLEELWAVEDVIAAVDCWK